MTGPFLPHVPLTTRRLVLRQPSFDDVPRLALYAGDIDVARMLVAVPHPYTEAHASAFVGDVLASNLAGDSLALALARLREPHAFYRHDHLHPAGEGCDHRLVARQALLGSRLRHRGGGRHGGPRLPRPCHRPPQAGAFEDNPGSLRVHEKTGFVRTGLSSRASKARGTTVSHVEMELTREAFAALSLAPASAKGGV